MKKNLKNKKTRKKTENKTVSVVEESPKEKRKFPRVQSVHSKEHRGRKRELFVTTGSLKKNRWMNRKTAHLFQ